MHSRDKALVRRLLAGDEAAYDSLFAIEVQRLYRFALARVGDADAAEDLVQQTLVKALPKLATYRGEASLLTWLTGFCRFEIQNWRRRRATAGRAVELPAELADDAPEIGNVLDLMAGSRSERAIDRLARRELAELVRSLLDRLPARYGDVLEWKYVEGLSVRDIARRLRVTRIAAQSILARARHAFRDAYTEIEAALREQALEGALRPEEG